MMNIAGMEEPSLSSVSNRGQDQAEMVPTSPADLDVKGAAQTANKAILDYLTHHSEEFRVLGDLQRKVCAVIPIPDRSKRGLKYTLNRDGAIRQAILSFKNSGERPMRAPPRTLASSTR